MKYRGRAFDSMYIFPIYSPTMPRAHSTTPAMNHNDTSSDVQPSIV